MPIAARRRFWSRTKNLTVSLLLAWLLVNLLVPWFARELSATRFFGFPLGYWLAAEGVLLVYLLLIVIYVIAMDRLELAYLQQAEAAEHVTAARDMP